MASPAAGAPAPRLAAPLRHRAELDACVQVPRKSFCKVVEEQNRTSHAARLNVLHVQVGAPATVSYGAVTYSYQQPKCVKQKQKGVVRYMF